MSSAKILVVDDDATFRMTTAALLESDGYEVDSAPDGQQAVERLKNHQFDLLLVDLRMPGIDGISLVEALRLWGHGVPILMISGFGTVETAVRALQTGVDDFLQKPVEPDVLSARVADLLERRPRHADTAPSAAGIVGRSGPMRALLERMNRVAVTDTTVLITGETGTGKELVARGVHAV
jgi:DNA-binding NtrC family response regulator